MLKWKQITLYPRYPSISSALCGPSLSIRNLSWFMFYCYHFQFIPRSFINNILLRQKQSLYFCISQRFSHFFLQVIVDLKHRGIFVQCLSPCSINYFVYQVFTMICLNNLFIALKECEVLSDIYWGKLYCLIGSQKFKFRCPSFAEDILGASK